MLHLQSLRECVHDFLCWELSIQSFRLVVVPLCESLNSSSLWTDESIISQGTFVLKGRPSSIIGSLQLLSGEALY
ncbi:unnamed protein product [Urochloa humidicola]